MPSHPVFFLWEGVKFCSCTFSIYYIIHTRAKKVNKKRRIYVAILRCGARCFARVRQCTLPSSNAPPPCLACNCVVFPKKRAILMLLMRVVLLAYVNVRSREAMLSRLVLPATTPFFPKKRATLVLWCALFCQRHTQG